MRKRLGVAAAMTAAFAFSMVGTAAADCHTSTQPTKTSTGPIPQVNLANESVAGELSGVGYGQADASSSGLSYDGSLSGDDIGWGNLDGDADGSANGTPSGSADGEVTAVSGTGSSGSLESGNLTVNASVAGQCITP